MNRFFSQFLAIVSIAVFSTLVCRAEVERTVGTIVELADELESRGVRLCVVRMPVRTEIYGEATDTYDAPMEEAHATTVSGYIAEQQLLEAGVPVINLYEDIRTESLISDIFQEDRFHFTPAAEQRIAATLSSQLRDEGIMMQPDRPRNAVFMGECFAESFAEKIIASDSTDSIKVLNKNGGGHLVHNYLFVFPDDYLEDTDVVVWIFTDRHFLDPRFATLEANPEVPTDTAPRTVVAEVKETTAFKTDDPSGFEYPDALRTSVFQVEGSEETFIGIDQILKNRQVTLGRKIRLGDKLRLKLVPWEAWIRSHPLMVKICMADDVEDFTLPRYWIEDWVLAE